MSVAELCAARNFLLAVLHGNTVLPQQKARLLAALPEGAIVGVDDMIETMEIAPELPRQRLNPTLELTRQLTMRRSFSAPLPPTVDGET